MDSEHAAPSEAALRLLNARFSGRCMVPRLRDIRWFDAPPEHLKLMLSLIVSPVLTNFRLGLHAQDTLDASQVVPVFEALAPAHGSLVEVRICHHTVHDPQITRAASDLLLKCNPDRIRTFRVDSSLSTEAFIHATQLPNLETFVIKADTTELDMQFPTSIFPSLKFLEIFATNTRSPLLQTIAHIQSSAFTRLELEFPAATLETFLPTMLAALRPRGLHQTLTMLSISPEGDFDLDGATIRPILFLNQLTYLDITLICAQGRCPYKLTDENLEELVAAMPKLEVLSLGTFPCAHPANSTIKSLASIAKHCKHLEQLNIHINAEAIVVRALQDDDREEDSTLEDRLSAFAGCPLLSVIFGPCFIPSEEQGTMIFVLTLLRLFPRLKSVVVFPPNHERDSLWDLVNTIIGVYRRIRINMADAGKFTNLPRIRILLMLLQLLTWKPIEFCACLLFSLSIRPFPESHLYFIPPPGSLEPVCTNAQITRQNHGRLMYKRNIKPNPRRFDPRGKH